MSGGSKKRKELTPVRPSRSDSTKTKPKDNVKNCNVPNENNAEKSSQLSSLEAEVSQLRKLRKGKDFSDAGPNTYNRNAIESANLYHNTRETAKRFIHQRKVTPLSINNTRKKTSLDIFSQCH